MKESELPKSVFVVNPTGSVVTDCEKPLWAASKMPAPITGKKDNLFISERGQPKE
jgi:hypothetical protein